MARRVAFLIGNENYRPDSGVANLSGARNDVEVLSNLLSSPTIGRYDVKKFIDRHHFEILPEIDRFLTSAAFDDLMLIYFAGHGRHDRAGRLCLATADSQVTALRATSIPVSVLFDLFKDSNCGTKIVILDCCFSGLAGSDLRSTAATTELQQARNTAGTFVLTATDTFEPAREDAVDENGQKMGRFTAALTEGLREGTADRDGDGEIRLSELYAFLRAKVAGQTPHYWAHQASGDPCVAFGTQSKASPNADRDKQRVWLRQLGLWYASGHVEDDDYHLLIAAAMGEGDSHIVGLIRKTLENPTATAFSALGLLYAFRELIAKEGREYIDDLSATGLYRTIVRRRSVSRTEHNGPLNNGLNTPSGPVIGAIPNPDWPSAAAPVAGNGTRSSLNSNTGLEQKAVALPEDWDPLGDWDPPSELSPLSGTETSHIGRSPLPANLKPNHSETMNVYTESGSVPPADPPSRASIPPSARARSNISDTETGNVYVPKELQSKYLINGILGRGAMAVVYDAFDQIIQRRVAIKVFRHPQRGDPDGDDARLRLRKEAQAAGRLSHPNIVGIYDYGENDDAGWIVMELIEGGSLNHRLSERNHLGIKEIADIMSQVLEALEYSHSRGVVHRDVKPANVMLTRDGKVKLADFGIARFENSSLTQSGTIMGTPAYMAPEQLIGEKVDARSDIWAAGVMFYQLLTGRRPFEGGFSAVMHRALHVDPQPPSEISSTSPAAFDRVIARALAKKPENRFQTAKQFAEQIRAALDGKLYIEKNNADDDGTIRRKIENFSIDFPESTRTNRQNYQISNERPHRDTPALHAIILSIFRRFLR